MTGFLHLSSIPGRKFLISVEKHDLVVPTTQTSIVQHRSLLLSAHLSGISCLVSSNLSTLSILCLISICTWNHFIWSMFCVVRHGVLLMCFSCSDQYINFKLQLVNYYWLTNYFITVSSYETPLFISCFYLQLMNRSFI